MYNKYLVTGATGFLGRAVVEELVRWGAQVHALALPDDPYTHLLPKEVRTVTENGVNRRVVPGIDDAIRRAFEESRLVDTRDFAWAVPGEPFALAGYRGFTGRLIKNSK